MGICLNKLLYMTGVPTWPVSLHDRCPYMMTSVPSWLVSLHDRCPFMTGVPSWPVSRHDRCPDMTGVPTWPVSLYDRPSEMIMNCTWMVLEPFMCSSWTLIHEQFMNYPWTWNGQVHEVGEVHELGVYKFEFMNLWVHELLMTGSSRIIHELLVHDLFMNNF